MNIYINIKHYHKYQIKKNLLSRIFESFTGLIRVRKYERIKIYWKSNLPGQTMQI